MDVAVIHAIGQGNPGALTVISLVAKEHPDKFAQFAEACLLRGLVGPDLWDEFKRKHRQNVSDLLRALTEQNDRNDAE